MDQMKENELPDELNLIVKILEGEIHLFEIIIRKYNTLLYKTGRSYGYSHDETQDLMQDSYINIYMALSSYEFRSTFKTWILKIMLNNCYKKRQKFSYKNELNNTVLINEKSIPMYSNYQQSDPDKVVINHELKYVIENSLEKIPVDYRMVFSLREINGLNVSETAEVLNITESNVKVKLSRAKSLLRNEIVKVYSKQEIYEFDLKYCDAIVKRVLEKLHENN